MSSLVEELKKEHLLISSTLTKVRTQGIVSKEGQKTLLDAKNSFLAHLKKEDEQLYPVLRKAAEKDPNLKRTLDIFAKDIEFISQVVLIFFKKYESGGSGLEFAKDFGRLSAALSVRIVKEENVIYEKFNELQ